MPRPAAVAVVHCSQDGKRRVRVAQRPRTASERVGKMEICTCRCSDVSTSGQLGLSLSSRFHPCVRVRVRRATRQQFWQLAPSTFRSFHFISTKQQAPERGRPDGDGDGRHRTGRGLALANEPSELPEADGITHNSHLLSWLL